MEASRFALANSAALSALARRAVEKASSDRIVDGRVDCPTNFGSGVADGLGPDA
jgi:hypothetical protein